MSQIHQHDARRVSTSSLRGAACTRSWRGLLDVPALLGTYKRHEKLTARSYGSYYCSSTDEQLVEIFECHRMSQNSL